MFSFKLFSVSALVSLGAFIVSRNDSKPLELRNPIDLVNPKTKINTEGPISIGGHKINDYRNTGPELPVWQVITESSNLGTARIAKMIGPEKQREFLSCLGFTTPTSGEMI